MNYIKNRRKSQEKNKNILLNYVNYRKLYGLESRPIPVDNYSEKVFKKEKLKKK